MGNKDTLHGNHDLPPMTAALMVWGIGALFYLLGFFHRVAPAVITEELMRDFQISAAALGNLSAFYFYSYVAMQIPTGILADQLGPRRLLSLGALIAAAGTVIFAAAPTLFWASAGRLLIGGSVAVAFVCLLKLAVNWFAPQRFALVSGLALFCGVVGAVFAGVPLRALVDLHGWRPVLLLSALVTSAICGATWLFVRDYPSQKGFRDYHSPPSSSQRPGLRTVLATIPEVFRYRNTWLLFLIPGGIVGCVLTFSGLWGVPFLVSHRQLSPTRAALLASVLMVAWAIGGPFFGWLSDRLQNRKNLYIAGCLATVSGWVAIIFLHPLNDFWLTLLLVTTGFCSGCMIISFAFAKESVPLNLSGTVSGTINMGVMSGPMILQPAVGWVLDRFWQGGMSAGVRVYDLATYQKGFSLMLAWISLSFLLLLFTRETGCQQLSDKDESTPLR